MIHFTFGSLTRFALLAAGFCSPLLAAQEHQVKFHQHDLLNGPYRIQIDLERCSMPEVSDKAQTSGRMVPELSNAPACLEVPFLQPQQKSPLQRHDWFDFLQGMEGTLC